MKELLRTIKEFQDKHPGSHVGGSLGLFLRGIDLRRSIKTSDVDMVVNKLDEHVASFNPSSFDDFDIQVIEPSGIKIDIKIDPNQSFDTIDYQGVTYNVSKLYTILYYKCSYCIKGSEKHQQDINNIFEQKALTFNLF